MVLAGHRRREFRRRWVGGHADITVEVVVGRDVSVNAGGGPEGGAVGEGGRDEGDGWRRRRERRRLWSGITGVLTIPGERSRRVRDDRVSGRQGTRVQREKDDGVE